LASVEPPNLTDGFNLVVDALQLDGLSTIYYGVVGIPVTDLARIAQAKGCGTSASVTSRPPDMPPPGLGYSRDVPASA